MIKNTFTILLSIILLVSHMDITIGTHYCGGEAVESRLLFGDTHLGCIMSDMTLKTGGSEIPGDVSHKHKTGAGIFNVPCCENVFKTIQSTDEYIKDASKVIVSDYGLATVYAIMNYDVLPKNNRQTFPLYASPPLEKKLHVLFRSFLI